MLISSNSFVIEIHAGETLEESFKVTPLPFWNIETEDVSTNFKDNTIEIISDSSGKDWLGNWLYRKKHIINQTADAGTNYQIRLEIHSTIGEDNNENIFLNEHAQLNLDDIRFTSSDKETELDYWFEDIEIDLMSKWTKYENNPVLIPEDIEDEAWGTSVVKNGSIYYMYYMVHDESDNWIICRANSTNKISWTKDTINNPIMEKQGSGWEKNTVGCPRVWIEENIWHMIYWGHENSDRTIGYANSTDGITWTNRQQIITGDIAQWDDDDLDPWGIIKIESTYYLWYNTVSGSDRKIGLAISSNLIDWEKDENNPIYESGRFCGDIFKRDEIYYMVIPHYTSGSDYSEFELYNDTNPTFYSGERKLIGIVSSCSDLDWDNHDTDCPSILTEDINRDTFPDDKLYCYYTGENETSNVWQTGIIIETDIDKALYHNESLKTGTFWIEISDDLSVSDSTIYIYYGNSEVSTTSNGIDTFLMFDDFASESISALIWDTTNNGGSVSFSTNDANHGFVAKIEGGDIGGLDDGIQQYESVYLTTAPIVMRTRIFSEAGTTTYQQVRVGMGDLGINPLILFESTDGTEQFRVSDDEGNYDTQALSTDYFDLWGTLDIMRDGTNAKCYFQDILIATSSCDPDILSNNLALLFVRDTEIDLYVDWIFGRKFVSNEPIHNVWGEEETNGVPSWEEGSFSIDIPIKQFANQKLEFMIDINNFTENLNFGIFYNDIPMNYNLSLNQITHILSQRNFQHNYSGYSYLRFKIDLKYATNSYKINCLDENNTKITTNLIYENVLKSGNLFRISSTNFSGFFHLYYFSGDVDYTTTWKETIINQDPNIETYLLSASALNDEMLSEHNISYNRYLSNFQFLRSNLLYDTDFSISLLKYTGIIIDIQFYKPDGSKFYRINGQMDRVYTDLRFYVRIYETIDNLEQEIFLSACGSNEGLAEMVGDLKFAVWRTQDNHLGMFFVAGTLFNENILGNPRFISNKTLENFQANITITYFSEAIASGYRNFIIELDGFEFGYGNIDGVAEPHFSSTWWDSIPIVGQIINGFIMVGNAIMATIDMLISPLFSIVNDFLSAIETGIGVIALGVWGFFEGVLNDIGVSINSIASDVFAFFDGILDAILGIIEDIYSIISDTYITMVNLSTNLIASIGLGITTVLIPAIIEGVELIFNQFFILLEYELNLAGTLLGWGDIGTFLFDFTDSVVLAVPSWLEFLINSISFMIEILVWINFMWAEYSATLILYGSLLVLFDIITALLSFDDTIILECLGKYFAVIEKIVMFIYNIISTILEVIWGILPF